MLILPAFRRFFLIVFSCTLYFMTAPIQAQTISIPLTEIVGAPDSGGSPDAAINRYLARQLEKQFDALGFDTDTALVFGEFAIDEFHKVLATVCPVPLPKEAHIDAAVARVVFDDHSGFDLNVPALQNITATVHLGGRIDTRALAQVTWGLAIPFSSNCRDVATDDGTLAVTLPFSLELTVNVSLDPRYDEQQVAIVVSKNAVISGGVSFGEGNIDADFGDVSLTESVINVFEDHLLNELKATAERRFSEKLAALNNRLNGLDASGNPDPSIEAFNQPSVFVIDDNEQNREALRAILRDFDVPEILTELLGSKGAEILLRLLTMSESEREAFLAELGAGLGCELLLRKYELPLPQQPLYVKNANSCVAADLYGDDAGPYYVDNACASEVAFRPTSRAEFCAERVSERGKVELGNAAWAPDTGQANDPLPEVPSKKWTTLPSTRLGIGVVTAGDTPQPFVKQLRYKTIQGVPRGNGTCHLEMRVYKSDVTAQNLKPMLAIHGGSWNGRGFSVLGLEATVRMFTAQGFAVFAPFYRLIGDSDGNAECNMASWREVTEDVTDALRWVAQNGPALGTTQGKITLFGQSAGGHLAAWLATHEPASVRKSLMFYPALDLLEFLDGAVPDGGRYAAFRGFGLRTIANFFGSGNGTTEVRLQEIDFTAIDPTRLSDGIEAHIPDRVFNLAGVDVANPPRYLARCAAITATDLASIDLLNPPPALLSCLKQDLSEFLVENSFNHQINDDVAPFFIVHGTSDTLIPHAQAINLCNARDGGTRPVDVADPGVAYTCGTSDEVRVISGAQHALDLGLCFGTVCPAGPPGSTTRSEVHAALVSAYQWAGTETAQSTDATTGTGTVGDTRSSGGKRQSGGGGALSIFVVLIALGLGWRKRMRSRNVIGANHGLYPRRVGQSIVDPLG